MNPDANLADELLRKEAEPSRLPSPRPDPEMPRLVSAVLHNEAARRHKRPEGSTCRPRSTKARKPRHAKILASASLPLMKPSLPPLPDATHIKALAHAKYEELRKQYQAHYQACQALLRQMEEL